MFTGFAEDLKGFPPSLRLGACVARQFLIFGLKVNFWAIFVVAAFFAESY